MVFNYSGVGGALLEDRLFKNALYLGLVALSLLIFYDSFYTKDYLSVIIELVASVFFLINLLVLERHRATTLHRYIFSAFLFVFVNIGWITGSGINLLNVSLYFLCIALIFIINEKKIYFLFLSIVLADYLLLFLFQYYTDHFEGKSFETDRQFLINDFIIAFFFILLGAYLIIFLKLNFIKERSKLNQANTLLKMKGDEISNQNKALKHSKEKLDKTIKKLGFQTDELISIQGSLEEKVEERTNDLVKLNERLLAQNQQLEQYAYITSHNLRAPIAQIKGLVHLLPVDKQYSKITKETIDRLYGSVENLEKVLADLSLILKLEKSMQEQWQEVNLHTEILEVIESLRGSLAKKNINIKKPAQNGIVVKAIKPYVYSVFHNIIENAVKYSDESKDASFIKLEFSETVEFQVVSITDNGIGIDMDAASGKVFQMYQRFNNTHPGQGFGLFMVKSQMEVMQGKVEMESILGQGTTFTLYFPK